MTVYCDECGKPLPAKEKYQYGGGYMCDEHMPDDAGTFCNECGADLNHYQAQSDAESDALGLVKWAEGDPGSLFDQMQGKNSDELRAIGQELARLERFAKLAKAELQVLMVNLQVKEMLAND